MRFLLLVPGTGHFYCGSCLRDDWLARALQKAGHDMVTATLYLPLVLERKGSDGPVHMGGINLYLQQKVALARYLPGFLANLLDRPGLLRWASRRGSLTAAPGLGEMTLSMLRGEHGRQAKELEKLVSFTAGIERPDVIVLSNAMLTGVARRLKQALERPVVVTLQGEAPFLDALPQPYADRAWDTLRELSAQIDAFIPVSTSYGELMRKRLGAPAERFHVVQNGLDLDDLGTEPSPIAARRPPTIGYLARMCRQKGLDTLVEAFLILKERGSIPGLRLRVAGVLLDEDRSLVRELEERVRLSGFGDHVEFLPNVERAEKIAFLRTLSVLSVPATYGESFGLYLLEAMAAGVPVVQPRCGAFPEILEATGGGLLCEPDDGPSLGAALEELLLDPSRSTELARKGRAAVLEHFTAERMAREFAEVCRMTTKGC